MLNFDLLQTMDKDKMKIYNQIRLKKEISINNGEITLLSNYFLNAGGMTIAQFTRADTSIGFFIDPINSTPEVLKDKEGNIRQKLIFSYTNGFKLTEQVFYANNILMSEEIYDENGSTVYKMYTKSGKLIFKIIPTLNPIELNTKICSTYGYLKPGGFKMMKYSHNKHQSFATIIKKVYNMFEKEVNGEEVLIRRTNGFFDYIDALMDLEKHVPINTHIILKTYKHNLISFAYVNLTTIADVILERGE